ncbi:hypothetical protein V6R21_10650 [Limibacter armeniacum]|uniref:hypothetical protein n=1 Tax=Limibacter armeniacum TaxID=466084 RepID=UPI002FE56D93
MKRLILSILASGALMVSLGSCSPYGKSHSAYYKKQRMKYEMLDLHTDCPQLNKRR